MFFKYENMNGNIDVLFNWGIFYSRGMSSLGPIITIEFIVELFSQIFTLLGSVLMENNLNDIFKQINKINMHIVIVPKMKKWY